MSSKKYFDEVALQWDNMQQSLFSEDVREKAFSAAGVKKGKIAADIGAGSGFITEGLIDKGLNVIAVDQSEAMLAEMRNKFSSAEEIEYRLGKAEKLPIPDEAVDYAFANMYLHHVESPLKAIKEMVRILKPGGGLMILDIVLLKELPDSIKNSIEAYVGCVSWAVLKDKYIEAIEEAGFKEVRIIDETSFPYESLENDPTSRAIIENLNISPEEAKEAVSSVISINIYGIKSLQD